MEQYRGNNPLAYDFFKVLESCAKQNGKQPELTKAALAFAAIDHPGISTERYENHIQKLAESVQGRHEEFIKAGGNDDAGTQLASLRDVISGQEGYQEKPRNPDSITITTLISTIDDRAGSPATITLLYILTASHLGWQVHGLDVPGRTVARIDKESQRLIFDPAAGCCLLQAHDIRRLVKQEKGEKAEISNAYLEPLSPRDFLMVVQNQIKYQKITAEDYEGALKTVQAMQVFAPDEYRLFLDAGVLYARTNQPQPAIFSLEHYIAKAPDPRSRQEALMLLSDLRGD